jgi:hypothetical protein
MGSSPTELGVIGLKTANAMGLLPVRASRSTFREISAKKGGEEPELNILVLLADGCRVRKPQLNKEEENNV